MIYWLPVIEITVKRPVLSVYSLLMCVVSLYSLLEIHVSSSYLGIGPWLMCFIVGIVGLAYWTFCRFCTIWPLMVYLHAGHYLAVFW